MLNKRRINKEEGSECSMRYFIFLACVLLMGIVSPIQSIAYAALPCTPTNNEYVFYQASFMPGDIVAGQKADAWFTKTYFPNTSPTSKKMYTIVHDVMNTTFTEYAIPLKADFGPGNHDITLAKDNNIWFTAQPNTIGRMTPTGKVTLFHTSTSTSMPSTIVDGPGGLWFIEQGSSRIGRITPQGKITEFRISNNQKMDLKMTDLTRGSDGNIWFTEQQTKTIGKITPQGVVSEFALPKGQMQTLQAITHGPDGNLWFTDANVNVLGRITPKGKITEYPFKITTDTSGGLGDIVAAADGNLWATRNANAMLSLSTDHTVVEYRLGSNSYPYSLSSGGDGTFWAMGVKLFTFHFPHSCVSNL
jgi:streptogramin lyase